MVIAFEEKDRAAIESKGMAVIEFKRILYRTEKSIEHAYEVLKENVDKFARVWNVFKEKLLEAVDSARLAFEQIKEVYHYPTSSRYRIARSQC